VTVDALHECQASGHQLAIDLLLLIKGCGSGLAGGDCTECSIVHIVCPYELSNAHVCATIIRQPEVCSGAGGLQVCHAAVQAGWHPPRAACLLPVAA
jgi:hypothetical protein